MTVSKVKWKYPRQIFLAPMVQIKRQDQADLCMLICEQQPLVFTQHATYIFGA